MNSDNVKKGPERAPNRSLFYALGYTPEELERPLIGVVSAYSEIVPGHMNLDKIADAVKAGVRMAGGTPILMPAIGVCDGIAMGHVGMKYSLASRELICDSVETMYMAHQLDGLVLVPNCDKIVPGMLMAAVRMDVPAVVCSGGPMLAGRYGGEEVSLSKMFEAVGAYKAGLIDGEQLEDCTCNCCPGCGSCSGMYTANSMNCLCEAIGIALPGNGTIPAVYAKRLQLGKRSGMAIMELVRRGVGWALLPEIVLQDFDGVAQPCSFANGEPFIRRMYVDCQKESERLPQVQALIRLIKAQYQPAVRED